MSSSLWSQSSGENLISSDPSTRPVWSVALLASDKTRSLAMEVAKQTISASYLLGNPEVIVETLHVAALVAAALGELKEAAEWSSESESLAKVLKDVASVDDASVVSAHVKLLAGEYAACAQCAEQLAKSHGDGLEDFKVLSWSTVLGMHARIGLEDMNEARELAAVAPDLLVYAAYLNDSSKANLLAACTLVDLYTHNLSIQPLATAMAAVEKTFQVFDVEDAVAVVGAALRPTAFTSTNSTAVGETKVANEGEPPESSMMLASSFQLRSTLSLVAMLKVLLAVLCNHHVVHADTTAPSSRRLPLRFASSEASMPTPKSSPLLSSSTKSNGGAKKLVKGKATANGREKKLGMFNFMSRLRRRTEGTVEADGPDRLDRLDGPGGPDGDADESTGALKSAFSRDDSVISSTGFQTSSSNLEMHHDIRFFLLGIGRGLPPTEDMCNTLGTTRLVLQNSVLTLLRILRKATRNFPVLAPEYEWCVGTYAWAEGRVEDATAHWKNQLLVSTALGTQRQIALAHFELARVGTEFYNVDSPGRTGGGDGQAQRKKSAGGSGSDGGGDGGDGRSGSSARNARNAHLTEAKRICEAIKARGLLRRVEEEMKISTTQDCTQFALRALEIEAVGAPLPVFTTIKTTSF
jgi:hypothetical protein